MFTSPFQRYVVVVIRRPRNKATRKATADRRTEYSKWICESNIQYSCVIFCIVESSCHGAHTVLERVCNAREIEALRLLRREATRDAERAAYVARLLLRAQRGHHEEALVVWRKSECDATTVLMHTSLKLKCPSTDDREKRKKLTYWRERSRLDIRRLSMEAVGARNLIFCIRMSMRTGSDRCPTDLPKSFRKSFRK